MAVTTLLDIANSRQQTMEPPSFTYIYKAKGEQNDYLVSAYAQAATPLAVFTPQGTLYRQDVRDLRNLRGDRVPQLVRMPMRNAHPLALGFFECVLDRPAVRVGVVTRPLGPF